MFWIKKKGFDNEEGYLYLRETIYKRDKRTHKKKPKKLCSGKATKERGKYSKKKDIYCGKIKEYSMKHFIQFKEYIIKKKGYKDYLQYKIDIAFDDLLGDFTDYLLYIHNIDKKEFNSGKKKVYFLANGYLCKETLDWIRRFQLRGNPENPDEIERFAIRCKDSGIFDSEVIMNLYTKLIPSAKLEEIQDELIPNIKTQTYDDMMAFMKEEHSK